MAGENKPALVALRRRRDDVIEALTRHFAEDALDLDEFEQRITDAHRATDLAALEALLADLQPLPDGDQRLAPAPDAEATALALDRADKKTFIAILSGVERTGTWRPPKRSRLLAIMGGAQLDFREAQLPPGVTEVRIYAVLGGAEVIVPPNLAVDCDGWGILGGFEVMDRAPVAPNPNEPLLRITGFAMMGGLSLETRLVGESGRDAKRRRRRERRSQRKASRLAGKSDTKRLGD